MKRLPFSRWFLLPLSLALLSQCRPNPNAAPADPKSQTPVNSVEAHGKNPDPMLPPPPVNPPVEAAKKTPPKAPEFKFVSHPALTLKKIGSLTQPVQSLALHPDCKAVAAAGKNWELARFGADGKLAWSTRKTQVPCPAGNRCSEFPRAQFLPNDNIVAMMDGDSLRMFNSRGRMLALRGGFLQAVLDFRVSPDGKIVGALYPHGLALWRTTGGLLRKVEIPGPSQFFITGKSHVRVAIDNKIMPYSLDTNEGKTEYELDGPIMAMIGELDYLSQFFLARKFFYFWDKGFYSFPFSPDTRPLLPVSRSRFMVLVIRGGKFWLQSPINSLEGRSSTPTINNWELAGVTPGADPVTAANDKCIAIASGNDVYFLALPDPLP